MLLSAYAAPKRHAPRPKKARVSKVASGNAPGRHHVTPHGGMQAIYAPGHTAWTAGGQEIVAGGNVQAVYSGGHPLGGQKMATGVVNVPVHVTNVDGTLIFESLVAGVQVSPNYAELVATNGEFMPKIHVPLPQPVLCIVCGCVAHTIASFTCCGSKVPMCEGCFNNGILFCGC